LRQRHPRDQLGLLRLQAQPPHPQEFGPSSDQILKDVDFQGACVGNGELRSVRGERKAKEHCRGFASVTLRHDDELEGRLLALKNSLRGLYSPEIHLFEHRWLATIPECFVLSTMRIYMSYPLLFQ
jgi:hypothetical protein